MHMHGATLNLLLLSRRSHGRRPYAWERLIVSKPAREIYNMGDPPEATKKACDAPTTSAIGLHDHRAAQTRAGAEGLLAPFFLTTHCSTRRSLVGTVRARYNAAHLGTLFPAPGYNHGRLRSSP